MTMDPRIISRICTWLGGTPQGPFMLDLRPTNRCNLRCPSCAAGPNPVYKEGTELSLNEYLRIIDEAAELGVRCVRISGGGEPMIRPEVTLAIMERAKFHSMEGWLQTNGTLFSEEPIKRMVEMEWEKLNVSIDGPDAQTNDFLRGQKGAFKRSTDALRCFERLKRRFGTANPDITINPVVSSRNFDKLSGLVKLAAELSVRTVGFQPINVNKPLGRSLCLTAEQRAQLPYHIRKAKEEAEKHGIRTNLHQFDNRITEHSSSPLTALRAYAGTGKDDKRQHIHCYVPWYYIGIGARGRIGLCTTMSAEIYSGDVRKHSLLDWWYGPVAVATRQRLLAGELLDSCKHCCRGVILVVNEIREKLKEMESK